MATYSGKAALHNISQWIDNEKYDISDLSEGQMLSQFCQMLRQTVIATAMVTMMTTLASTVLMITSPWKQ